MTKIIALVAAGFMLAGCSTFTKLESTTISPRQVKLAAETFDGLKATATNYLRLPDCGTGQSFADGCKAKPVVAPLIAAVRQGTADRDNLEAWIKANPAGGVGGTGLYDTLEGAVTIIQAIYSANGVK